MLYYSAYSNDNVCIPDFALLEIKKRENLNALEYKVPSNFQWSELQIYIQ